MSDFDDLIIEIKKFRDARNWKQFHNPKDMAISLSLESAELLENFQWKNKIEVDQHVKKNKKNIENELVDILYWVLLISSDLNIDIKKSFVQKMQLNKKKYPIKKARGKHTKYTKL